MFFPSLGTMVLKALDPRLRQLVERSSERGHRSLVVLVGDNSRNQLPLLHHLVTKSRLQRPSVLWCFKKELGFTSNHHQGKKRMKAWQKKMAKGGAAAKEDDFDSQEAFHMFLAATNIR